MIWIYVGSTVAFVLTLALAVINSFEDPDSADRYTNTAFASTVIWLAVMYGLFNVLIGLPEVAFGLLVIILAIELDDFTAIMEYERSQRLRYEVSGSGEGSGEADG